MATADVRDTGIDVRISNEVLDILDGAVDLHAHPGPSPFPRRIGIAEAAHQAARAGFSAIVAKSHHHSMVTDILAVEGVVSLPIPVYSGVALNDQVGGMNPYAVDLALKLGGRIVWFPTISSAKHIDEHEQLKFPTTTKPLLSSSPRLVVDSRGKLTRATTDILDIIHEQRAILAGGHLPAADLDVLIDAAWQMGIERISVQHPNFVVGASPERARQWAEKGAVIEHSLCMYDDRSTFYHWELSVLLEYIDAVGPERTALVSDLGQRNNPLPVESYERIVTMLLDAGVKRSDVKRMCGTVPAQLLGVR